MLNLTNAVLASRIERILTNNSTKRLPFNSTRNLPNKTTINSADVAVEKSEGNRREETNQVRQVFRRDNDLNLDQQSFEEPKEQTTREKISPNTFQYWRKKLRELAEAKGLTSTIRKGENRPSNEQEKLNYCFG